MRVKFISLNTLLGGIFFDPMLEFLETEAPDILALQEVYDTGKHKQEYRFNCLSILSEKLNLPHKSFAPVLAENSPSGKREWGNGILSRFPITSTNTIFYDVPYRETGPLSKFDPKDATQSPRNLQHALILTPTVPLHIFNTQGIWGVDPYDNPRRIAMGGIIAREVADHQHTILCGDFNVNANTKTIGQIEKYLINIFKGKVKTSFNMRKIKPYITHPGLIDMILISPDIKVVSASCPDVDISDHLPQILEFEA